ncbi:DUF3179 domain-containing protein [Candidatus Woesearchaeota archaeon]|nr:DUF3179 domain-containing protein [Candidatus Woesearchaeota archaeon]
MKKRKFIPIIAIIVIIILILIIQNPFNKTQTKEENLVFLNQNGEEVTFEDFKGKNLIVNSWASWCPFCINEIPDLQKVADELKDVEILFIHRTSTESKEKALNFIKQLKDEKGIEIKSVLFDKEDLFYNKFFGKGMPVTLFLDKNGKEVDRKIGPMTESEIRDRLNKITEVEKYSKDDEIKTLADGTKYIIHPDRLLAGGPPKDGIPSIDSPKFTSAEEADWLDNDDLIIGLNYNDVVKAYPYRILNWHEIVNDWAGNKPILVTYCPLCRTGIAFERDASGEALEFGTSGRLYNSALVMYDRKTDSYWSQPLGKAIIGELTGTELNQIPIEVVEWEDWKKAHPSSLVLSKNTGHQRNYDIKDLYNTDSPGFSGIGVDFKDQRLESNAVVYGIELNKQAKAYSEEKIKKDIVINDMVDGKELVIVWNKDLGGGQVYNRNLNGVLLEFSLKDNKIVDNKGNEWSYEDMTKSLERINAIPQFWFSWLAFYPETELYQ